ncbi:putative GBF-interacting protein [Helianthus annuus]|uniref:GBF-interacting protein n=1 Tax=Helianthus annuus TaxID=4232 RepID=A0A251T9I7_HELAN|nr:GBF-interacting protein 1 isoform X1 [Helianthus annuus]KAF5781290.1 putative GBF-interacting protein [Helianthus annuus]KAJ0500919.1 putative GBF-interacting protein [Helianthus annuus]KAJ0508569.1 putative GBF-interacting protein [Helianthus annuus]KAJ0516810.1 putative GBF-interacting protein [Helianthus annuus]KAJ0684815.1 putative GBF-interacting protein [Helianthus annuus]
MSSGEARVSIPHNARKLIQQVTKTLTHNHTDAFVYSTLIDSAMDPAEATRRLKMIHDIREIAGKHSVEDVYTMLKECNLDANEAAQRLLYIDTFHVVKKKHDRRKIISSDVSQENKQTRGNQWRGDKGGRGTFYASKVFEDVGGGRNLSSGKEYGATNRVEKVLKPAVPGHMGKENNIVHVSNSCANVNGTPALSNGNYNHKLASVSPADIASPTSDHVVVSSQNTKHMCAVGTIKCEIVKRSGSNESNARIPAGKKFTADQSGTGTISIIAEAVDSDRKSNVAEKNQISDSSQPLLSSTQNSGQVVNSIQDNQQHPQSLKEPLNDLVPEEESELTISASKLDVMLEKLTLSSHQAVIFPDHIQVPEKYKSQFVFGTLDVTIDDCKPISVTESTQQNEVVKEPSLSNGNASAIAQEGEVQDHVSEDVSCLEDNIAPESSAPTHEQTVEIVPPPPSTGFQNIPVLQTTRDYYGYMPPLMGPHFVQLDLPEPQNGHSQAVSSVGQSPVTQPAIASQSTLALSPPLFPYFRPYPNYIPYNPYFPHMYLPPNAHLLTHGVFPQPSLPPTAVNVHHMAATAGLTIPTPSQNKQGSNEDNTASETKDNTILSTVQQVEDTQARAQAPLDLPNILPNYFYGFPHGQHMAAFSPLQAAALYHSSQTMTAQSTIQPPFMYQQPPPTGGTIEHSQHQHAPQINHNDTALVNTGTG